MDDFREQVKKSFQACKNDIESLNSQNSELLEKISSLEEENGSLREELDEMRSELKGIKIALEYIKDMNQGIPLSKAEEPVVAVREEVTKKLSKQQEDPYEALLAYKAKTNKRELLKQKIISMIGENGINLSELKFMFVEHFKYCSKATFYNYLKELEIERILKIERENSRNMVFLTSIRKEI